MTVICLVSISNLLVARTCWHTCSRPLSSRSPRNLTNTISSNDNRTRSRGSETESPWSPLSAIVVVVHETRVLISRRVNWNCRADRTCLPPQSLTTECGKWAEANCCPGAAASFSCTCINLLLERPGVLARTTCAL